MFQLVNKRQVILTRQARRERSREGEREKNVEANIKYHALFRLFIF